MQVGLAQCVNKGMQRDCSMDKASQEFAYENKNIRITTNGDNSFLSVTNEKSTIPIERAKRKFNSLHISSEGWLYFDYPVESNVKMTITSDEVINIDATGVIHRKQYNIVVKKGEKSPTNIGFGLEEEDLKLMGYEIDPLCKKDEFYYYLDFNEYPDSSLLDSEDLNFKGVVLGSTTIGDYVILFTKGDKDYIYRVVIEDNTYKYICLYSGNLNFNVNNPIECITSYEADSIQKVYWVDGINQPRVINICNVYNENATFDFSPSVNEDLDITIEKEYNGVGNFQSGVVQYYVSYYNKYGPESNIAYISPLYYISPKDRGGKVNENQSCSFRIKVTPKTNNLEYIRIYSIVKTSLNGEPSASIVGDLNISNTNSTIQIIDTNNNTPIASTDLLFLGGTTLIPNTIEQKDNTLFLGNITEVKTSFDVNKLKNRIASLKTSKKNWDNSSNKHLPESILKFKHKLVGIEETDLNSQYDYYNQLNNNSSEIKGFKHREIYRFGIQLQSPTLEWSQTIWLDDAVCDKYPMVIETLPDSLDYYIEHIEDLDKYNKFLCLPYIWLDPTEIFNDIDLSSFINYRLVMVEPTLQDRSIVCQGYVNPTLYNTELGHVNSWTIRPINNDNKHWENVLYADERTDANYPTPKTEIDLAVYEDNKINNKGYGIKNIDYSEWYLSTIKITYIQERGSNLIDFSGTCNLYFTFTSPKYPDVTVAVKNNGFLTDSSYYRWKLYNNVKSLAIKRTYTKGWIDWFVEEIRKIDPSVSLIQNINEGDSILTEKEFPYIKNKNDIKKKDIRFSISNTVSRSTSVDTISNLKKEVNNHFFIDASTCSLHIPNFNEVREVVNNSNLNLRIVGLTNLKKNITDYVVQGEDTIWGENEDYLLDLDFNGNYDLDKDTYGLQGYPLWRSFKRGNNEDRYNMLYTWNSNDLSKATTKDSKTDLINTATSIIKEKVFGNLYIGDTTTYKDILWKTPSDIKSIKAIDEVKSYFREHLYNKDVEYLLTPKRKIAFATTEVLRTNFQPFDFFNENFKLINLDNAVATCKIDYTSTPHILLEFAKTENDYITVLPHYENYTANKNIIDLIYEESFPKVRKLVDFVYQNYASDRNDYIWDYLEMNESADLLKPKEESVGYKEGDLLFYSFSNEIFNPLNNDAYGQLYYFDSVKNGFVVVHTDYPLILDKVLDIIENNELYLNFDNKYYIFEGLQYINNADSPIFAKCELDLNSDDIENAIWIAELYKDFSDYEPFGGTSENAIELNTFIPISQPTKLSSTCNGLEGDTYFQRWDSLRVYPTEGKSQGVVDVVSLMIETHDNLDGRDDINRGRVDVTNFRPDNTTLINNVYSQTNNYITSSVLDEKFEDSTHPTLYAWSLSKQAMSDIDNWTSINLVNSNKLDGDKGALTKIKRWNNQLLAFQEKGLAIINFNQQAATTTSEGVPVIIANSNKVLGHHYISSTQGCKNKWSISDSPYGLYFIDGYNKSINVLGSEGIKSLSTINLFQDWTINNEKGLIWNPNNNGGFKSFYDAVHNEIYFVNDKTALCYNEILGQFTSFYDYEKLNSLLILNNHIYGIKENSIHKLFEGDNYCNLFGEQKDYYIKYKINKDPFIDKTWTNIEYRADVFEEGIISDITSKRNVPLETFDVLKVWNEYQYGESTLNKARCKFRIWRADIPRDTKEGKGLNRIRNPWIMLEIGKTTNTNKRMEFHDLLIKYLQ